MFPSSDDKRMRAEGMRTDAPTPPADEQMTPESVCAFIIARLRYDFISDKDSVNAYVDITQPWQHNDFPVRSAHENAALYVNKLESLLFRALDTAEGLGTLDPMVDIYFRKVIIRSHYHGVFRISVSGDIIESAILAAA